jgi:ABC-type multidrug transport system fused ATPase/permease subunit
LPQGAAVLVGFAIIAFGLLVLAFIISRTLQFLAVAPTDLGTAVISASALVFVALIANFGAKIYERRQQIQQEQRAKKAEVYEEFMAFWFRLLTGEEAKEEDEQDSEDEAAKDNGASDEEKDKEPKNEEPSPEFQNEVEA